MPVAMTVAPAPMAAELLPPAKFPPIARPAVAVLPTAEASATLVATLVTLLATSTVPAVDSTEVLSAISASVLGWATFTLMAAATPMLLARSFPPHWDATGMSNALEVCARLATAVPVQQLEFVPDASVLEAVRCGG